MSPGLLNRWRSADHYAAFGRGATAIALPGSIDTMSDVPNLRTGRHAARATAILGALVLLGLAVVLLIVIVGGV